MSLWIVDGGIGFALPVIARVEDWKEGEHIDVTGAGDDGKWLPMPVRYVSLSSVHDGQREMADRIERLEAENAELRAGWAACDAALEGMHLLHNQAEAENAELRELCEDMLDCIEIRNAFERPPTTEMCEEFADRMRELGAEVD